MKRRNIMLVSGVLILGIFIGGCSKADEKKDPTPVPNKTVTDQNETKEEKTVDYVLYLRHKDKPFLFDEKYSVKENDDKLKGISMEEFIINEQLKLVGSGEYKNAIPKETKLLSIEKSNKLVTVNLSKDFIDGQRGTSNDTMLSLAAIINAMTILPENEQVQFTFDGQIIDEINGIDTSKPFAYIQGLYPDK